jgi:hypothetical protein
MEVSIGRRTMFERPAGANPADDSASTGRTDSAARLVATTVVGGIGLTVFLGGGLAHASAAPVGQYQGTSPGVPAPVWEGKTFRGDGTVVNRVAGGLEALPASVYSGPSISGDGRSVVHIDYADVPVVGGLIHDEITPDAWVPDVWHGTVYATVGPKPLPVTTFILAR